ncbi:unnamed protein product [Lactuca virosa]|uniref:Uncharacterized protein n=1 Tax=Lactuca virosa TaxID=75947 RepID=A0AAU9ML63_9ASTR|nr:unnamed protein product [Lactuca virosa]
MELKTSSIGSYLHHKLGVIARPFRPIENEIIGIDLGTTNSCVSVMERKLCFLSVYDFAVHKGAGTSKKNRPTSAYRGHVIIHRGRHGARATTAGNRAGGSGSPAKLASSSLSNSAGKKKRGFFLRMCNSSSCYLWTRRRKIHQSFKATNLYQTGH